MHEDRPSLTEAGPYNQHTTMLTCYGNNASAGAGRCSTPTTFLARRKIARLPPLLPTAGTQYGRRAAEPESHG